LKNNDDVKKIQFVREKANCIFGGKSAFKSKSYILPNKFYKYMSINENAMDALNNEYVWCGKASKLNDPFECRLNVSEEEVKKFNSRNHPNNTILIESLPYVKKRMVEKELKREEQKIFEMAKGEFDKKKEEVVLTSFCEINDNPLMWGHYADGYKGICVEYLLKDIEELTNTFYPVIYSETMHGLSDMLPDRYYGLIKQMLTKSLDWSYEKEWRIVNINSYENVLDGNENGIKLKLKANKIFLGPKIKANEKEMISNIGRYKDITVVQTSIIENKYKIII